MDTITQYFPQLWACGWVVGLLLLRQAVVRTWKQPNWRKSIAPLRGLFNTHQGLLGAGMCSFLLWWYLVPAITFSILTDWTWEPEEEKEEEPE